ncbi:hypothetical protein N1495_00645 [Streptococcus didelphis]|uniref:Uncharacterized protein n=1 Tax=Streptococcus didelphis TaxID=102886 RepID=A0ABY9LGD3_9STRE|nr:hypothetical protein [Streptococcus didelphis]WMB27933.1 hypothetical protein N1496_07910 [Streptococcus didelphis]WMB29599.1 hypothetical protein N1495_00645 [Streptococcus didelphis]
MTFKQRITQSLSGEKPYHNSLATLIDKFVIFSKKYGGLVVLILIVFRFFFPIDKSNDIVRTVGMFVYMLGALFLIYVTTSLLFDIIKGYYLKKYLEDYRQISGYSIEWYGKTAKIYKESLKKDVSEK